jgi:hypothetical protein
MNFSISVKNVIGILMAIIVCLSLKLLHALVANILMKLPTIQKKLGNINERAQKISEIRLITAQVPLTRRGND